jgi:hypothetical protein
MTERGASNSCVFCGQPFEPGQDRVGRGASVAHPGCADRALADDEHWDQIADQVGEPGDQPAERRASAPAGKSGCLALAALALMLAGLLMAFS